jgi:Secretion system C-terminal sorting domain
MHPKNLTFQAMPQHLSFPFIATIVSVLFATSAFAQQPFWKTVRKGKGDPIVALATRGSDTIFAAVDTVGILRSTDHGTTWQFVNKGLTDLHILSIAVQGNGTAIAGSIHGYMFRSTNDTNLNDDNWALTGILPDGNVIVSLAGENGRFYATSAPMVYRSTDDGRSWVWYDSGRVMYGNILSGTMHPGGYPVFGVSGGVVRPINDGYWWAYTLILNCFPCFINMDITALAATPYGFVFAGSASGINRANSDPNGWSFQTQLPYNLSVSALASDRYGRLFAGTRGYLGVFESKDNGESWNSLTSGMNNFDILSLVSSPDGFLYAGCADGTIIQSAGSTLSLLAPITIYPPQDTIGMASTVPFHWRKTLEAKSYRLQISTSQSFAGQMVADLPNITDTSVTMTLVNSTEYYWRVASVDDSTTQYSTIHRFLVGQITPPVLVYPPDSAVDVPTDAILRWTTSPATTFYYVTIHDSIGLPYDGNEYEIATDTVYAGIPFKAGATYEWNVSAIYQPQNIWSQSPSFRFTAGAPTSVKNGQSASIPKEFSLAQNYPNPFNPTTVISYQVPINGFVKLEIYDVLGRKLQTLVSEHETIGTHSVTLNASELSSGVYFYRLSARGFIETKKLLLIK